MTGEPSSVRPVRFPAAYGPPGGPDSLLPWSYVEERLRAAANYWITTVGPPARPHARPVDGVWVGANPSISVHLSSEAEAIILEGTAEYVTDPSHPLAALSMAASKQKYPQYFSGSESPFRPFWALRPTRAYAWTLEGFPHGATRWRFFEKTVQP